MAAPAISAEKPLTHGDQVGALIALNQNTLDRHLQELVAGGRLYTQ
ncbi:MAG: hypothetical protein ACRD09_10870 [Vicinamibacterales bacterium]